RCVQVVHPISGKPSSFCSNDDLWNTTGPTSGWQAVKVDLMSTQSDFQLVYLFVGRSCIELVVPETLQKVPYCRCVNVPDPKTGRSSSLCFNDELWNATGASSGWKSVKVDLSATSRSDFQFRFLSTHYLIFKFSNCMEVVNPLGGKATSVCFNEDVWNTTGSTSGWQKAAVELGSINKGDFQCGFDCACEHLFFIFFPIHPFCFIFLLSPTYLYPHLLFISSRCVQIPDPVSGKTTNVCFNDDLWNITVSTDGWKIARVDLVSSNSSDFQLNRFSTPKTIWATNNSREITSRWSNAVVNLEVGPSDFQLPYPPFVCLLLNPFRSPQLVISADLVVNLRIRKLASSSSIGNACLGVMLIKSPLSIPETLWSANSSDSDVPAWRKAIISLDKSGTFTRSDFQVNLIRDSFSNQGFAVNNCKNVRDADTGEIHVICFNDELWKDNGSVPGWKTGRVDLSSSAKSDFQMLILGSFELSFHLLSFLFSLFFLYLNSFSPYFLFSRCVQVHHPLTGKLTSICSTDDLWNATGSTSGWQNVAIDLNSTVKSDFQPIIFIPSFSNFRDCIQVFHPKTGKPTSVWFVDLYSSMVISLMRLLVLMMSCGMPLILHRAGIMSKSTFLPLLLGVIFRYFFKPIILEGVIPAGFPDAKICVDNITSYNVSCSELEPKPAMSTSNTYTWAQYFGITFIVALAFGLLVPILFLVGIIVICRRRHAYRHHCMTNGSGGGMSVGGPGSGSYGNSKLFSANLWHYIGGKEVADDPFAEHTASIHRPPFATHKFSDGTMGIRGDGTLDLPDVVIPSGRVVGGTLMRNPQPSYNGTPYGYQTMMATGKGMRYNGMTMGQQNTMMPNQPNFPMEFGAQGMMQGNQMMMAPGQVMVQQDPNQQQMMMQPSNYFQSLAQPAGQQQQLGGQQQQPQQPQMMLTGAPNQVTAAANVPLPTATTNAASVTPLQSAPVNAVPDENGPFVLPDPPSDHQQERDQVAAALDALNAATEPPQSRQITSVTAAVGGEHPPPGYDEAVGMAVSRASVTGTAAAAPVLPPRRSGGAASGEPISLAQRYGLPVAEI
ncbi:unnamed protein product, partial [Rodentolepis nana]|uniref:GPS domain-containing protein n=1 Tax=Rodentolepis nana TaxID=102285 RepID=A0A158QHJ0_RODNA